MGAAVERQVPRWRFGLVWGTARAEMAIDEESPRFPRISEPFGAVATLWESTPATGEKNRAREPNIGPDSRRANSVPFGAIGQQTDGELLGRFCQRRDEAAEHAFAALVERHGPMVLNVCRSTLRNEHDAQDAFQATFLILVRRARAVAERESIGSWLYGVALRVAACAGRLWFSAGDTSGTPPNGRLHTLPAIMGSARSRRFSTRKSDGCRSVTARRSCSATWRA